METNINFVNSSKFKLKSKSNKSLDGEKWVTVKFNDNYKVSNKGRILTSKGIIAKPFTQNSGYLAIGLWRNHKKYTITIHKLVAMHFLNYDDNYDIDHIDGNRKNNDVTNLRLITHKENCNHRHGLKLYNTDVKGNIIKVYKSYEEAAKGIRVGRHRLERMVKDDKMTPIYSNVLKKTFYFKRM